MVYAPFGKARKTWPDYPAYLKELNAFKGAASWKQQHLTEEQVIESWLKLPGHMSAGNFAKYKKEQQISRELMAAENRALAAQKTADSLREKFKRLQKPKALKNMKIRH